jgi:hypothetical protein
MAVVALALAGRDDRAVVLPGFDDATARLDLAELARRVRPDADLAEAGRADAERAGIAAGLASDSVFAAVVSALAAVPMALVALFMAFMAVDIVLADEFARVAATVILVAAELTLVAADETFLTAAVAGMALAEVLRVVRAVPRRAEVRAAVARRAVVPVLRLVVPRLVALRAVVPCAAVPCAVVPCAVVLRVADLAPFARAVAVLFDRPAERLEALVLTDRVLPELAGLRRAVARVVVCTGTEFPPS